ncbi:hypothetical protein BDN70DRAFT_320003 [Pholiota conissans]|uniref:Oxidoreductase N-terminal domain-containing protein n=1 Tax=Pholiota conissans TaxID=109636 RepID=A0A9P5YTG6_9AGAR|nr:hypothetical protein BDN70DRAFT_320003 [Pholiota conissans]
MGLNDGTSIRRAPHSCLRSLMATFCSSLCRRYPEPGKHIVYDTLDLETVPLNGGFFSRRSSSPSTHMRGQMREAHIPSYMPAFPMGEPIYGAGIGAVLCSEHSDIKASDHVTGLIPHQQYSVVKVAPPLRKIENPHHLPWSFVLGVLGMPGQTAFMGWSECSRAKKGETVFLSAGAGVVGSLVIQLAKMDGYKVIASVGSDEKSLIHERMRSRCRIQL